MEKDVFGVTKIEKSLHLSPEVEATQEALLKAIKTVCFVYTKTFSILHVTHELQGKEDLS